MLSLDLFKSDHVPTFRVGVVTLNRPKALNALCAGLMDELIRYHTNVLCLRLIYPDAIQRFHMFLVFLKLRLIF